ncbi:MAG: hypothetical protein EBU73_04330 [Chitinophagia bacterium]|nr:hypothetical protein [Chitinophagia bacterium]
MHWLSSGTLSKKMMGIPETMILLKTEISFVSEVSATKMAATLLSLQSLRLASSISGLLPDCRMRSVYPLFLASCSMDATNEW